MHQYACSSWIRLVSENAGKSFSRRFRAFFIGDAKLYTL